MRMLQCISCQKLENKIHRRNVSPDKMRTKVDSEQNNTNYGRREGVFF